MSPEPPIQKTAAPPRLLRAALVALVILLVAVTVGSLSRRRQRLELEAETRELAVPTVSVVSPAIGKSLPGLPLPAEVKPWIEAPIHARASGYLKRWLADLGSRVEAGQLLAEIDTPELDQQLERSRHEVSHAEAALALAKLTADRYAGAVKSASVSEQEAAEKQADFELKTAALNVARAEVRRLEELKSFARITAPFSGGVMLRNVDVGDLITADSGKELFRLAQTDKLRVFVRVPQAHAAAVAPGQAAELLIPERPGRVFALQVARVANAISGDSRTLLIELEADNSSGEILAGSFAQVRLTESRSSQPLTLPGNVFLFRAEGPQVAIVGPAGKVELRSVKLGRDLGGTVEVSSGVGADDRVILNPPDSLAGGAAVRVIEPTPAEKSK